MTDEVVQIVIEEFSKLGLVVQDSVINVIAHLWPLAIRQVYVDSFLKAGVGFFFLISGIYCFLSYKDKKETDYSGIDAEEYMFFEGAMEAMLVFSFLIFAAGLLILSSSLNAVLNVEWRAIVLLVSHIKKLA